jgi:hypothetical protein
MDCPICRSEVKNLTPPLYRGLVVGCTKCGAYRIAKSILDALVKLEIDKRLGALQKAKAIGSNGWPTINRACL